MNARLYQMLLKCLWCFPYLSTVTTVVSAAIEPADLDAPQSRVNVLSQHRVVYSEPLLQTVFKSAATFDPRGMHHVYAVTKLFLNLVQRKDVLPRSVNVSEFFDSSYDQLPHVFNEHKEELLLQYIGVLTLAICGILAAVAIPLVGFFVCCCRCAGKCGGYPEHFDKRGDSCKRMFFGVVLASLVVAAMFGVVTAFVTNYYSHQGVQTLPKRLMDASDDTRQFLKNTGDHVDNLLVRNFEELEGVLFTILDESDPIVRRSLAQLSQEVAMDNLADIVNGLGEVKKHLKDIQNKTLLLQDKVGQLQHGLDGSKQRLGQALRQCGSIGACADFLKKYSVEAELKVAAGFVDLPFELPDVSLLMKDIADLVKVNVKLDVENSIGDIRPAIKKQIRSLGQQLSERSSEIQNVLNEFDGSLALVRNDIPRHYDQITTYGVYMNYIGLGMGCLVLLILFCYVLALFYGFCGKRPGNIYGDDCCNTGTGANWLLSGVYLTFMFSFVVLFLTTVHFLVGSTVDKVVCTTLNNPNDSEIFQQLDVKYFTPMLKRMLDDSSVQHSESMNLSLRRMLELCHGNQTIYSILQSKNVFDVEKLRGWRESFGVNDVIDDLKAKITSANLEDVQILSPQAQEHLQQLAESQISDLNFTRYTRLFQQQITRIDLDDFIEKIREVRKRLDRKQLRLVGSALENEALFLENMNSVVRQMKDVMRQLKSSVTALEKEAKFNRSNFKQALRELIKQAATASEFLRREGPRLVGDLANKYVNETVGLIDVYVDRVIVSTKQTVGRCHPVSLSYNATVNAVCKEIVEPFNGFWASIGWCYVLYLSSIALALALVSLYRKSEPYPGPLVQPNPPDDNVGGRASGGNKKARGKGKNRRGHRRNPSEYLPDSAHHRRAGYSYQTDMDATNRFQDAAPRNFNGASSAVSGAASAPPGGPPSYNSNLNLANLEYDKPPPYYYPGASAPSSAPPPLPAPNRR